MSKRAYCWHILLGFAVLRDGRVVIVALWTAGRSAFTIDAMIICNFFLKKKVSREKNRIRLCVDYRGKTHKTDFEI